MSSIEETKDVEKVGGVTVLESDAKLAPEILAAAEHDKALALLTHTHVDIETNAAAAAAVKRKIDRNILPLLVFLQFLQLLDKSILSYGAIMGLRVDTNVTALEYSWLGSIVYFGFLVSEVPTHILLQRIPIAKFISGVVIAWGIVVLCAAATTSFAGMATCRFIMGLFEACTAPALVLVSGSWYTPKEQISRIGAWYCMTGVVQIIGGLLAFAFYHAASFRWQALFILCGGMTTLHGILMWFRLASSPTTASFLNEEEKVIALERLRSARTGTEAWAFNKGQLIEAAKDVRLYYLFFLLIFTGLPAGGVQAFGPTIIAGFGFNTEQTTLLAMAPGGSVLVGLACSIFLARTRVGRAWTAAIALLIGMVGVIVMLVVPESNPVGRYIGYCIFYWYSIAPLYILAFLSSAVSGTTKKLAFNLSYNLGYCIGNIIGPQTYTAASAPTYYPAKFTMVAVLPCAAVMMMAFWYEHYRLNQKNAKLQAEGKAAHVENDEFLDLSDKQQKNFRYPY